MSYAPRLCCEITVEFSSARYVLSFQEVVGVYCSSCGVAMTQGLSYYNHCGAKVIGEKGASKSSEVKPEALVWGMVAVLVFGIAAIVLLMMAMKMVGLNVSQILAFVMMSFLLMLLVEGVFIWKLLRRKRGAEETGEAPIELYAAQARVLPEPMPSVTEHTTRAFEPIYSDRKSK